jgi:hypothetical protein
MPKTSDNKHLVIDTALAQRVIEAYSRFRVDGVRLFVGEMLEALRQ